MDDQQYYEVLCSHDRRFDGKFFVGENDLAQLCGHESVESMRRRNRHV